MASTSVSTLPHAPPSPPSRPAADLLAPISRRRPGPGRRRRRPCAHVQRTARQQGPSCNEPLSQPPRSRHAHALGGFPCRGGTYVLAEPTGRGPLPPPPPSPGPARGDCAPLLLSSLYPMLTRVHTHRWHRRLACDAAARFNQGRARGCGVDYGSGPGVLFRSRRGGGVSLFALFAATYFLPLLYRNAPPTGIDLSTLLGYLAFGTRVRLGALCVCTCQAPAMNCGPI